MKAIDLSEYREIQKATNIKTITICYVRLDKKTILNTLLCEEIYINGNYFKVPEDFLIECLRSQSFGETRLELEKIEK